MRRLLLVLGLFVATAAAGQAEAARFRIGGYVSPAFAVTLRPGARPVDYLDVGLTGSSAGLIFVGQPNDKWRFKIDLTIGTDTVRALTNVAVVDHDNDGEIDGLAPTTQDAISNIVEEATITWAPVGGFDIRLGKLRIPFSAQSQSHNMTLMFPSRSGVNETFLAGTDLGALFEFRSREEHVHGSVGLFNGTGLGVGVGNTKGVLITGRIDLNPMGGFDFDETGLDRGPFKIGIGAGLVYNPYNSYDTAGQRDVLVNDIRASASLRMAGGGFYFLSEGFYRRQTDTLTDRPVVAGGASAQFGVYLPAGVEPVARVGWAGDGLSFDARHTIWIEAGANIYPLHKAERPDAVKFTVQYLGEDRITEVEWAHGAVVRAQVKF